LQTGLIHVVAISAIVFVFSVLGDLSESLFKRNFGVKDSGSIMPGHGGLLDRFDGALIAFPVAIAYIKLFQLI
jgi:phosphatidate cytidylyltransferase